MTLHMSKEFLNFAIWGLVSAGALGTCIDCMHAHPDTHCLIDMVPRSSQLRPWPKHWPKHYHNYHDIFLRKQKLVLAAYFSHMDIFNATKQYTVTVTKQYDGHLNRPSKAGAVVIYHRNVCQKYVCSVSCHIHSATRRDRLFCTGLRSTIFF